MDPRNPHFSRFPNLKVVSGTAHIVSFKKKKGGSLVVLLS